MGEAPSKEAAPISWLSPNGQTESGAWNPTIPVPE